MNAIEIIRYIVWYATQNDIHLTTNRLVKFIYLADLYHARLKDGEILTGFPWRFVHYGPYCSEAMEIIEQAVNESLICKRTFESRFEPDGEYNIFSCNDDSTERIKDNFNIGVLGQIQNVIKKYGEDTPRLLDYVYFNTEPMTDVKKGDLLDFSKVQRFEPTKHIKLKKLSPESVKLARGKIKMLGDEILADMERLIKDEQEIEKYKDEEYYKFIKMIDGDELEVGLKGTSKIQITE